MKNTDQTTAERGPAPPGNQARQNQQEGEARDQGGATNPRNPPETRNTTIVRIQAVYSAPDNGFYVYKKPHRGKYMPDGERQKSLIPGEIRRITVLLTAAALGAFDQGKPPRNAFASEEFR